MTGLSLLILMGGGVLPYWLWALAMICDTTILVVLIVVSKSL